MTLSLYSENEILEKIKNPPFDVESLSSRDPQKQFLTWYRLAKESEKIIEPSAMCLATSSLEGRPSCRIVLAQSINEDGFIFFTNYNSKKAQELDSNPQASVCFYWDAIQKQIVMDGAVRKITREESRKYFESRDVESQICFLVSEQGKVLKHKRHLLEKKEKAKKEIEEKCYTVPFPNEWGGYLFTPKKYEFWQGDSNRLDNRVLFRKAPQDETLDPDLITVGENGWIIQTLSP